MKRKIFLALCLASGAMLNAAAQKHESIMHIRATAPAQEVTLLDLVKADDYERAYSYNEYGYITSVMVKNKFGGVWESTPTTPTIRTLPSTPPEPAPRASAMPSMPPDSVPA